MSSSVKPSQLVRLARGRFGGFAPLALVLATATCADVSIQRVGSKDFDTKGARYYLPRPYLAVKQSFPVAGEDFLTTGSLQDDHLVHLDLPPGLPGPVLKFFNTQDPRVGLVAPGLVMQRKKAAASPGLRKQAAAPDGGAGAADAGATPDAGVSTPSSDTEIGSTSGSTVVPISELYDVVMLPDFDQQYAVRISAGIGSVKTNLGLKNGWMAEQIGFNIDNSAIGTLILSNIQKVADLGLGAAQAALEPASALTTAAGALSKQGKAPGEAAPAAPAPQVVLRVRYALEALPGLYPILKPMEAEKAAADAAAAGVPAPRVPPGVTNQWVFVPYPPYTVVAYQVRETILVELVSFGAPTGPAPAPQGALSPSGQAPSQAEQKQLQALLSSATGKKVKPFLNPGDWATCGTSPGILVVKLRSALPDSLSVIETQTALQQIAAQKSLRACGQPIKTVFLSRPAGS
jgi:hypothetical protein